MSFVKKLFALTILIIVITLVANYFLDFLPTRIGSITQQSVELGQVAMPYLQSSLGRLDQDEIASRATALGARGNEVLDVATTALETAVAVDESRSKSNMSEKIWEYGRYLYCQQVVEEWEKLE